jgi:hypothetical protein
MYVPTNESGISQYFGGTECKAATRLMESQHREPQLTTNIIIHKSTGKVVSECLPRIIPLIFYIIYSTLYYIHPLSRKPSSFSNLTDFGSSC